MDNASITRFIVLIVALINAGLNLFGFQTIPDDLTNNIVFVATGFYTLYVAWRNNYIGKKGRAQKDVLERHNLK